MQKLLIFDLLAFLYFFKSANAKYLPIDANSNIFKLLFSGDLTVSTEQSLDPLNPYLKLCYYIFI